MADIKKQMAVIIGTDDCLFQDGSYPCPEGKDISGSNMCDYCKADQILNLPIERVCPRCKGRKRFGSIVDCPNCNGTGKITKTAGQILEEFDVGN